MSIKCLIIDEMHPSIIPGLEELGIIADYQPQINRSDILEKVHEYTGLVVRSKTKIDVELLDKALKMKFIARAGAGLDQINVGEAVKRNILLLNAPEGNRDALGEHAIGMLLTLMNKIHIGDREVKNFIWDRESNRGYEISGKTIALIGYGFMGKAFAQRLQGFDCKVIAFDKYLKDCSDDYAEAADMQEIYHEADILSLHVPLNNDTRFMVNRHYLEQFHKNVWLLNTSRGEVVDTGSVCEMLDSGKVLGAALDVLENEKFQSLDQRQKDVYNNLFSRPNVLLSPHVGGWSYESYKKINRVLIRKIKDNISQFVVR